MAPRRVDPSARPGEILAAAMRVFARKGFAASRIEDVATEAGIGKGSIYLYFPSREALLDAAFATLAADSEAVLHRARTGSDPPLERLATLVRNVLAAGTAAPELARIVLDLWSVGRAGPGLPLDMAAVYHEYRTVITELLREAQAAGSAIAEVGEAHAAVVVGAIEGCLLQWVIDPRLPIADLCEPIIAVCLDGLRCPPGHQELEEDFS